VASKEEIILMTKLALQDKKYARENKKLNSYFKWDYIYINNWSSRVAAGIAALIIIGWLVFKDIYMKEIIPIFEVELGRYLYKYIFFFIVLIVVYSGISTMVHKRKYQETQERLDEYQKIIRELDQYQYLKETREKDYNDTI